MLTTSASTQSLGISLSPFQRLLQKCSIWACRASPPNLRSSALILLGPAALLSFSFLRAVSRSPCVKSGSLFPFLGERGFGFLYQLSKLVPFLRYSANRPSVGSISHSCLSFILSFRSSSTSSLLSSYHLLLFRTVFDSGTRRFGTFCYTFQDTFVFHCGILEVHS